MTEADESYGLVLKGTSERKSLHFLVLAVVSPTGSSGPSLKEFSAAGAPQSHYFSSVKSFSDPKDIQDTILDVRRQMAEKRKNFYLQEVEEQFQHFLSTNISRVLEFLESDNLAGLEKFIQHDFYKFDISELNVDSFPYRVLQEREQSGESSTDSNVSESTGSSSSGTSPTTIEVAPEIDVQDGTRVEELEEGTPIVVRLTERSAELFGSSVDQERPRLPGEFLDFDPGGKQPEGEFRVRLQEDLHGVGEVSRGSLIRRHRPGEQKSEDEYERQLQPLVVIVVSLMLLLVVFAYLVIF